MFKERRDAKTETIRVLEVEPMIWVAPLALDKMALYVQQCDKEIGWLGRVQRQDKAFIIHDVYLFKQEVNATTCEISPEGLSDFVGEVILQEGGMEIVNNLRLWGHSHVNMGVSPSSQDETQVQSFKEGNPFFVRVIANKSGEMEFCIYDFENAITYKNVKWREWRFNELELAEQIKAEIASKVTTKTYASNNVYYSGHNEYRPDWEWDKKEGKWMDKKKNVQTELKVIKSQTRLEVMRDEARQDEIDAMTLGLNQEDLLDEEILAIYQEMDIDEIFTDSQLWKIALCDRCCDVENLISKFGLDDDCISIEPSAILAYAQKKTKVLN